MIDFGLGNHFFHYTASAAAVGALAVGGGSAIAAGVDSGGAARAVRASEPDVTVLFGRALLTVRAAQPPVFAKAVVYEADGSTTNGRATTSASAITKWRFVFDNSPSKSRFASATLTYGPPPARFGKVTGSRFPFLEDVVIARAPKLTLTQAVAALRKAGYRSGFTGVTLRRPLGPHETPPLYLFSLANGRFVSVNTVTRKVSKI